MRAALSISPSRGAQALFKKTVAAARCVVAREATRNGGPREARAAQVERAAAIGRRRRARRAASVAGGSGLNSAASGSAVLC